MKKALIGTALASGILLSAQTTLADTGYVGIDYQMYTYSVSGQDDAEPESIALKLGGSLNQYFKVEARLGRSVKDDNTQSDAVKVSNTVGFYLKGGMDVMNMVFPYFITGYSKYDIKHYGDTYTAAESAVSWGVGADFHYQKVQVGVEWMRVADKSQYDLEAVSVSAAYRF